MHLRDGWISTPVYQGDIVHVLAHVDVVQGQAHAMCDHATGARATRKFSPLCMTFTRVKTTQHGGMYKGPRMQHSKQSYRSPLRRACRTQFFGQM